MIFSYHFDISYGLEILMDQGVKMVQVNAVPDPNQFKVMTHTTIGWVLCWELKMWTEFDVMWIDDFRGISNQLTFYWTEFLLDC